MEKSITFRIENEFEGKFVKEAFGYDVYKTTDQEGNTVYLCTYLDGRLVGFSKEGIDPKFRTWYKKLVSKVKRGFPGNDVIYYLKKEPQRLFKDAEFILIQSYRSGEKYIVNAITSKIMLVEGCKRIDDIEVSKDRIHILSGNRWRSYTLFLKPIVYKDNKGNSFADFDSYEDKGTYMKVQRKATDAFLIIKKENNTEK